MGKGEATVSGTAGKSQFLRAVFLLVARLGGYPPRHTFHHLHKQDFSTRTRGNAINNNSQLGGAPTVCQLLPTPSHAHNPMRRVR